MQRKIQFVPHSYYHIYNRGVDKRKIFLNDADYRRFLMLLYLCNSSEPVNIRDSYKGLTFGEIMNVERKDVLVHIGAYCLMPNHIHLLISPVGDNTSFFMQKLFTAYAMYFNKKNERTGRLFESAFKAKLINEDEYLKYLFAYIHLNPVKLIEPRWKDDRIKNRSGAEKFLKNYNWSSYLAYAGDKNDSIINKEAFPNYFQKPNEFNNFIKDWLDYENSLTKV